MVDKLNLRPVRKETINLAVFGNNSPSSQDFNIVKLNIKTQAGNYIQITAVVVPQISTPIRNMSVRDINKFQHLQNIKLAHPPTDDTTSDITVLIGADYYWDIVENHTIRGIGPTAVASKLGYLLSGPCYNNDIHQDTSTFFINAQPKQLDDISTRFWDLQSIGITDTREENKDDVHSFQDKFIKRENNHYVAKLSWKTTHDPLPTNLDVTTRRTRAMIKKLSPDTRIVYDGIIRQQERQSFIERVISETQDTGHYLPHHATESLATPVRVVYDCSYKKINTEPSPNDCLQKGPPLVNELTGMLIRISMDGRILRTHHRNHKNDITKNIRQSSFEL